MTEPLWVLAALCVVVGLAGTVVPVLPGVPLVWLGLALAAWADRFARVSGWTIGALGLLAAGAVAIDLIAGAAGAKRVGASRWAVVGAALGAVGGLFFGLPGVFVGPFVGAVAGELVHARDLRRAGKVGLGTALGLAAGIAVKLTVAFSMVGLFVFAYLV